MNTYKLIKKEIVSEPYKTPSLRAVLTFGNDDGDVRFGAIIPAEESEGMKVGSEWVFDIRPAASAAPAAPAPQETAQ